MSEFIQIVHPFTMPLQVAIGIRKKCFGKKEYRFFARNIVNEKIIEKIIDEKSILKILGILEEIGIQPHEIVP